MDKRQKSALRSAHIKLADELILDEDFYAALRQNKIFTDGMMALIKGEKKPRDRVYKMLELLEKRGPNAFENFVWILKENYEWLADMLEQEYEKRKHAHGAQPMRQTQCEVESIGQSDAEPRYIQPEPYRVCNMSTLANRSSVILPATQIPASASYVDGGPPRFFPYQPPQIQYMPQLCYDSTDHITVHVSTQAIAPSDTSLLSKQYKDACMSPIGIIQSPRKTDTPVCSPPPEPHKVVNPDSDSLSNDLGFEEIQSEASNDEGSQCDHKYENSEKEAEDSPDGKHNVSVNFAGNNDEDSFPSGEVYYEHVRRGSSCLEDILLTHGTSGAEADIDKHVENKADDYDDFEDDLTTAESSIELNPEYMRLLEEMKALYIKLTTINSTSTLVEDEEEITWDMINAEVDKMSNQLADSDDSKMIKKCYKLFSEKERRLPLNISIEAVINEKKEVMERLNEKRREIDQMVYDMWNHQQDMKNIEKLKKTKTQLQEDNTKWKASTVQLESMLDKQKLYTVQMEVKIQSLETKVRDLEDKQSNRRGPQLQQRRMSNAGSQQSTRRNITNNTTNSTVEPRYSSMQNAFASNQLQSPRPTNTTARRIPISRR